MTEAAKVRRGGNGDVEEVVALARAVVGAPNWSGAVWGDVLSAESDTRAVFVAEMDGRLAGFVVVAVLGAIAEIESLAVADNARRRGLGLQMCEKGVAWAREVGAMQMELEVRASNAAARALYRALGFQEQGMRRGYYAAPVEDAVLMGMALGGEGR